MNTAKFYKISVLFFILFCSLFCSCGKEEIPKSSLEIRDNLLYKKNSNVPFTGRERALVDHKIIDYEVKDGLKHGKFRIFSEEGSLEMEGQIDSNRNVGNWKYFYSDGKVESEGNFNFDRPDGKWIWNYPDGKRKEEGIYRNGERIGMWYQYDNNGEVVSEKNYDLVDSLDSEIDSSKFFIK